jgi:hypothetical protein
MSTQVMNITKLVEHQGDLYYADDDECVHPDCPLCRMMAGMPRRIVLCVYDAGDCDTIKWPNPNVANLRRALFDDRECGQWAGTAVILPDGTVFEV